MSYLLTYPMQRIKMGNAFFSAPSPGGVASKFTVAQLYNPVGSGKTLNVYSMRVTISTAGVIDICLSTTLISGTGWAINNKIYTGGSSSVAQVISSNLTSGLGSSIQAGAMAYNVTEFAAGNNDLIILPPGTSVVIQNDTTGNGFWGSFSWWEE